MLTLMRGVVDRGTAGRLRYRYQFKGQLAAKTGTTQNHSDGWFVGVCPDLVSGVWVGAEDRSVHFDGISMGQGANMALPIWALYMRKVFDDESLGIYEDVEFEPPENFNIDINCDDYTLYDNKDIILYDDELIN